ncbi:MAG: PEGA domain-containing protein [Lachnospiraceae bacterium]|nr:PEGA domain-containing protein [Lachnospiraceae bacterium]
MKKIRLFGILVLVSFLLAACTRRVSPTTATSEEQTEAVQEDTESFTGTIKEIDLLLNVITFVDVRTDLEYRLDYNGGVMITNKYGDLLAISQLPVGEIVDVYYDDALGKLVNMHVNENAMRYENVKDLTVNLYEKTLKAGGENLQYTDNVVVYDGDKLIEISALSPQDELVLRVYDGKLCSATVEAGHGYVKLVNYETYIGGMIEIGYDVIVPVTENMVLTVKEGEYQLRITKGSHTGTRYVTVTKDVETTVDLSALQIEPDKTGAAVISVLPEEASPVIYVDGTQYEPGQEIELVYGRHIIRIIAEGYERFAAYLIIDQAYKKYEYTLQAEGTGSKNTTESSTEQKTTEGTENTTEKPGDKTTENQAPSTTEASENTVMVTAPVGAKLYLDGDYIGETPCSFTKTPGKHIITLTREGCITVTHVITLQDNGKNDTFSFDELELMGNAMDFFKY